MLSSIPVDLTKLPKSTKDKEQETELAEGKNEVDKLTK